MSAGVQQCELVQTRQTGHGAYAGDRHSMPGSKLTTEDAQLAYDCTGSPDLHMRALAAAADFTCAVWDSFAVLRLFAWLRQTLTAEEAQARQHALAKMRSLLLHHSDKARHLKNIKSKDFHRRANRSARLKACSPSHLLPVLQCVAAHTWTKHILLYERAILAIMHRREVLYTSRTHGCSHVPSAQMLHATLE